MVPDLPPCPSRCHCCVSFFFFNDTATTEIYTLSLHDALPICDGLPAVRRGPARAGPGRAGHLRSEEHTSELQSQSNLVCRLLLEKKHTHRRPLRRSSSAPTRPTYPRRAARA